MRRLAAVDWILIGTLLPICVFGALMSAVHGTRGEFVFPPMLVSSAPDATSHPIVRRLLASPDEAANALFVGDQLVRVDGTDLRGLSLAGFGRRWSAVARSGARSLSLTIERDGAPSEVRVPFVPGALFPGVPWWAPLPLVAGFALTAVLLLVRATHWHLARRAYVTGMVGAFVFTPYFDVPTIPEVGLAKLVLGLPVLLGLTLWCACELIPEARLWGLRQRALTVALTLVLTTSFAAWFWLPDAGLGAVLMRLDGLALPGFFVAIPIVLTLAYRRSEPLGRRQIKWIVYGSYVAMAPSVAFQVAQWCGAVPESLGVLAGVAMIAGVASPLSVLVAIAYYQFLDIDRLFGATLSYSLLVFVGLTIVLGGTATAARVASDTLGLDPTSGQLLLSVGIAAILVPVQRVVRPRVDQLLFPERVMLAQGFERLLVEISSSADMQGLMRVVGERLDALLRPASAVLYARTGHVFAPVAVRGRTAPPAFPADGTLISALQAHTMPLAAKRCTRGRAASLTPFDRAALETLDVAVVVPFRGGSELLAFSCLGPKRSGDIYTPTDLAWLGAVAGKVSDRLLALDAEAVADQARAMQESLRRYVPGAVADRIVSGRDLEAGERDVTVLFVDIRDYTSFSEPRGAEDVFQTVNRYTETVSQLVGARGGVVVEFHGDGMLAVFGAPDDLPMKEHAAVQAGRDVVASIAAVGASGGGLGLGLAVGVGIATGPAFVGNIQSTDRFIWTVIGNTVNLAARLQSMTRELEASVAIDDVTFRGAGNACADFVRHGDVSIRGRSRRETVHVLPFSR